MHAHGLDAHGAATVPATGETDYEHLFISQLDAIHGVVAFIARRHWLTADEVEEFTSVVHTKLIDHDYAILRKFQGRCSLRTYLTVVIQRLFLDYRVSLWGKWRPSAQARRDGSIAMLLERLTMGKGLSFDQACIELRALHHVDLDVASLEAIYRRLPMRARRYQVGESALVEVPSPGGNADRCVEAEARSRMAVQTSKVLAAALASLPLEDRLIIELRFVRGLTVKEIAESLPASSMEHPKALYRRLRRLLDDLRDRLEEHGVQRGDALDVVGGAQVVLPRVLARPRVAALEDGDTLEREVLESSGVLEFGRTTQTLELRTLRTLEP
jgi:RNA polymerase sigma factor (sigma-70 family)